tara:strand:- start:29 stop:388 length:360 start_codon:yes stop_codon:yes gene_type:complete
MENWKRFLGMKRKIPAFMPYPRQKHKLGRSKDAPYNEYDGSRGWFDWDAYVEWYKNKQSVQHRGREMPKGGPFGSPSDQQNYEMAQRYGDGIGPPPVFMKDHQKQFLIQEPTDPDETNT